MSERTCLPLAFGGDLGDDCGVLVRDVEASSHGVLNERIEMLPLGVDRDWLAAPFACGVQGRGAEVSAAGAGYFQVLAAVDERVAPAGKLLAEMGDRVERGADT